MLLLFGLLHIKVLLGKILISCLATFIIFFPNWGGGDRERDCDEAVHSLANLGCNEDESYLCSCSFAPFILSIPHETFDQID